MSSKKSYFLLFISLIIILFKKTNNKPRYENEDRLDLEPSPIKDPYFPKKDFLNKNKDKKQLNFDDMIERIKILKEENEKIEKQNDDSKNKLKKYHLYYYIMVILNFNFGFIIIFFILHKLYNYSINLKQEALIISAANNDSQINQNNKKFSNFENVITTSSFIIEGVNNNHEIINESLDKEGNVAPAVGTFY